MALTDHALLTAEGIDPDVADLLLSVRDDLHDRELWQDIRDDIPAWHPRNDGDDDADDDADDDDTDDDEEEDEDDDDKSGDSDDDDADDDDDDKDDDANDKDKSGGRDQQRGNAPRPPKADATQEEWKRYARQMERRANKLPRLERRLKRTAKENEQLKTDAKTGKTGKSSGEDPKKLEQRLTREITAKVKGEVEVERRGERIEAGVTRLAASGVKIVDDDTGDETTVKFADADDAVTFIERAIRKGDIDEDELFDDRGRIDRAVLEEHLGDLLIEKPRLRASSKDDDEDGKAGKSRRRRTGSADAGRGKGSGGKVSVADDFKSIQKNRKD